MYTPDTAINQIIEINVGGKVLATTYSTLAKDPTFYNMIISKPKDKQGRPFIDRDHTHFKWIINYFRNYPNEPPLPASDSAKMELLQEAKHFHIKLLENHLNTALKILDTPSLRDTRPCSKGVFFFKSIHWGDITNSNRQDPYNIGIKFLERMDDVSFYSIKIDANEVLEFQPTDTTKSLSFTEKNAMVTVCEATITFSWITVAQSLNPQLSAIVTTHNQKFGPEDLGFIKEEN